MEKDIILKLHGIEDRVTVSGILVKNGYRVEPVRVKIPGRKVAEYGIRISESKANVVEEG